MPAFLRRCCLAVLAALALAALPGPSSAARADALVRIGFVGLTQDPPDPVSPLDEAATDLGLQGARLGIADDNATGRFLNIRFALEERVAPKGGDPAQSLRDLAQAGVRFALLHLPGDALVKAASAPEAARMLLFNSRAPDDAPRTQDCRANLLHTVPSRAMQADALAQYLAWKRWTRWFLVVGQRPEDRLYADAIRRAAERFGGRIVAEKDWAFKVGTGRADTGHVTLQTEIPAFTRGVDYDVLIVADEADDFGDYLDGRTALPRPVAGTQGLVATGWSPVNEQWGAAQLQSRFRKQAGRRMTLEDYAAWLAVRSIGEAAVRTASADPDKIAAYLRGPDFLLAAFKGQGLSFRPWDGQMRQPMLIAGPRLLVSVSPQEGFLHPVTALDTLGFDRPESKCRP